MTYHAIVNCTWCWPVSMLIIWYFDFKRTPNIYCSYSSIWLKLINKYKCIKLNWTSLTQMRSGFQMTGTKSSNIMLKNVLRLLVLLDYNAKHASWAKYLLSIVVILEFQELCQIWSITYSMVYYEFLYTYFLQCIHIFEKPFKMAIKCTGDCCICVKGELDFTPTSTYAHMIAYMNPLHLQQQRV